MQEEIKWIVENWELIPEKNKTDISYTGWNTPEELEDSGHVVVLLLDRQKPSVEQSFDFDEERIGVNKNGKIYWGFDSGCSCPSPWEDGLKCYSCSDTWKQFEVELSAFDEGAIKEMQETLKAIKSSV